MFARRSAPALLTVARSASRDRQFLFRAASSGDSIGQWLSKAGAALSVILVSATAHAQPEAAPSAAPAPTASETIEPAGAIDRLRIGARLGANFASVASEPERGDAFTKPGFGIGGFATFRFAPLFEAEVGLGFSQRGFKLQVPGPEAAVIALDYIDVPALARLRIPWGKSAAHLRLAAGFNFGILASAQSSDIDESVNLDDVTWADVALVAGAGIDFAISDWLVLLEYRREHGLLNTVKNPAPDFTVHNRVNVLMVGAAF